MLRSVVVITFALLLVGTSDGVQIASCHKKGTTCSSFEGRVPSLPGKLATTKFGSCPGSDQVMLDCQSWDRKGCIATDCMRKSSVKSNAQCRSITVKDSSPNYAHSINAFQESCASKSEERVVCCQPDAVESILLAGYGAEPHEFPHQVLILPKPKQEDSSGNYIFSQCGATIYNEKWIITAAHCVVNEELHPTYNNPDPERPLKFASPLEGKQVEVVVGSNIPGTAPASHRYQVKSVTVHKDYSALKKNQDARIARRENPAVTVNDMALLELETEIQFNDDTMAIKIAPPNFLPERYSDKLMIIGWGTTDNLQTAEFLQKGDLVIRDERRQCAPRYRGFNASQHLCIGGYVDGVYGKTAGGGDSGGPAICRDAEGQAILCGVTSFGGDDKQCSETPSEVTCPSSVYADVSFFRDWIIEKAGPQDTGSTKFMNTPLYGIDAGNEYSQVKVRTSDGKTCGGTLVASDTVVTAAHCAFQESGEGKPGVSVMYNGKEYALSGASLLTLSGNSQLERKNERFNRRFKKSNGLTIIEDPYFASDVAMLKLSSKVSNAQPAAMSSQSLSESEGNVYEVSWMRNSTGGLRKFPVNVLEKENCEGRYNRISQNAVKFELSATDVCMVEKYSGGSSCDREVGGGVFCGDKLCGVQVFRMCDFSAPRIITDISYLAPTIQANIK